MMEQVLQVMLVTGGMEQVTENLAEDAEEGWCLLEKWAEASMHSVLHATAKNPTPPLGGVGHTGGVFKGCART